MRSKGRKHSGSKTPTEEHKSIHKTESHHHHHHHSSNDENEPDWGDSHENFDEIYEITDESDVGNVQQNGSVIMHLLSQVFNCLF